MSGAERMRRHGAIATSAPSLYAKLREAHARVPDQRRFRHIMAASELGFEPDFGRYDPVVSEFRVRVALWRKARRQHWKRIGDPRYLDTEWRVFEWSDYASGSAGSRDYGGGNLPYEIRHVVKYLRAAVPGARFRVHALKRDPVLEVVYGGERLFVAAWTGRAMLS